MSSNGEAHVCDALYAIGHHLLVQERILEAADVFRALMIEAPNDERGWLGLTECHRTRGEEWIGRELLGVASLLIGTTPRIEMARQALETIHGHAEIKDEAVS